MRRTSGVGRLVVYLLAWGSGGLVTGLLLAGFLHAQQSEVAPTALVFAHQSGLVLNFIRPDRTTDFELVVGRMKEALETRHSRAGRQQATTWKVFRAAETVDGSVLYLFSIDGMRQDADYSVFSLLAEAFPEDAERRYAQFANSYASVQTFMNLSPVPPGVE